MITNSFPSLPLAATRPEAAGSRAIVHRRPRATRHRPAFAAGLALAALALAQAAGAATFCVSNGIELQAALDAAENNGQDDQVRIREGAYTRPTTPNMNEVLFTYQYQEGNSLSISGGWNAGCTTQTANPALTFLDGYDSSPILLVEPMNSTPLTGQISLSNLTAINGATGTWIGNIGSVSMLHFNVLGTAGSSVTIENVSVRQGVAKRPHLDAVYVEVRDSGSLRFRNNVVALNDLSGQTGTGAVALRTTHAAIAYVNNNTIVRNVGNSYLPGLRASGVVNLANNVVAGNTSPLEPDGASQFVSNTPGSLRLVNNHFGSVEYLGGAVGFESGTTSGDPRLALDTLVPLADSVLLDSGSNAPLGGLPGTDARGLPRIHNVTVDRGALERHPPTQTGPVITDLSPAAGSNTLLQATADAAQTAQIFFFTQAGLGTATTTVTCTTTGSGTVAVRPLQTVSNGGMALPVTVSLPNPAPGQPALATTVRCIVVRANVDDADSLYYHFQVRSTDTLFNSGFETP